MKDQKRTIFLTTIHMVSSTQQASQPRFESLRSALRSFQVPPEELRGLDAALQGQPGPVCPWMLLFCFGYELLLFCVLDTSSPKKGAIIPPFKATVYGNGRT